MKEKRWGLTRRLNQNLGIKDGFESNDRTIEKKWGFERTVD